MAENTPQKQPNPEVDFWTDLGKSIGNRIKESFKKTLIDSIDMTLGSVKDAAVDTVNRKFYGSDASKYHKGAYSAQGTQYNKYYQSSIEQRQATIASNNVLDFRYVSVPTVTEAQEIQKMILENIDNYDCCRVQDIKEKIHAPQTPMDYKYGWTPAHRSAMYYQRINGEYVFRFPQPVELAN